MVEKRRPCTKCGRNRSERFFVSARGRVCSTCRKRRVSYAARSVRLMENYGITEAEYDAMREQQMGLCAICGGYRKYNLDVDHDHAKQGRESVRGLLCKTCNRRLLHAARDSCDILWNAIKYLEDPPAQRVLNP